MKLAYCGHDFFSECLEELIEQGHKIDTIFVKPDGDFFGHSARIISLGLKAKSKIHVGYVTQNQLSLLSSRKVELLITAAYPKKIPDWKPYVSYAINIHSSALPYGKGPFPISWAILKKLDTTAVTIHELDDSFDTGKILLQEFIKIPDNTDLRELSILCKKTAKNSLSRLMENFQLYWTGRINQTGGDYWPYITPSIRLIDPNTCLDDVDLKLRAFRGSGIITQGFEKNILIIDGNVIYDGLPTPFPKGKVASLLDGSMELYLSLGIIKTSSYIYI